jgi:hypothetical protein
MAKDVIEEVMLQHQVLTILFCSMEEDEEECRIDDVGQMTNSHDENSFARLTPLLDGH